MQSPLVPSNPADIPQALLAAPTVAKSLAGVTVALYVLGQLIPSIESVLAIKVFLCLCLSVSVCVCLCVCVCVRVYPQPKTFRRPTRMAHSCT